MPNPLRPTGVVFFIVLATFGFLYWRASLPNNRQQSGMDFVPLTSDGTDHYVPRLLTEYENAVTVVTARNFAKHGFLATHLLPNRGGHPLVSLYDKTKTQCVSRDPPRNLHPYWNMSGEDVMAASINNDCVYTHYPPLADWLFGAMAMLGLDTPMHYKTLAILGNCACLLLAFWWLRRQVHPWAAALTIPFAATLPTFLQWGDTLYYHPIQFPLLLAGLISWHSYLSRPCPRPLALTWLFFFLEAFASYQLTLCFGIVAFGMHWIAMGREHRRARRKLMAILALAPCTAFALHFTLVASYLGLGEAWANLRATYIARVSESTPGWIGGYWGWVDAALYPLAGIPVAVLVLVALRSLLQLPWRKRVAHLSFLFIGGLSFTMALPGTTSEHTWMMFRHLIPFVLLLIAFLLDATLLAVRALRALPPAARSAELDRTLPGFFAGRNRRLGLLLVGAACVLLTVLGVRNATQVKHEVAWNRLRNLHENPANLALKGIDVVYWNEGSPRVRGNPWSPLTGIRVAEPPGWQTDLRPWSRQPWHYEIWWADPVRIQSVQLLLYEADGERARRHCALSFFDEAGFAPAADASSIRVRPFAPAGQEPAPAAPQAWLRVELPSPVASRALRLTCSGLQVMALRQVEAYEHANESL